MKKIVFLILIAFSGFIFAENASAQKKVAVYVKGNISTESKSIVSSAALSRLSGNKEYAPFARNSKFLESLMDEHDYQTSGEVPESEIRKIGMKSGVDYVIVFDVTIGYDNNCYMTAELLNLETGAIIKTVDRTEKFTEASQLQKMTKYLTYRLISKQSR